MSTPLDALAAALVTRWAALPVFIDDPDNLVDVRRGAPVGGIGSRRLVAVEFDGSPEARDNGRFTRTWLDLACTRQQETGELMCSAIAQTGDDDITAMESMALDLVAACDGDLRSDLSVGGLVWSQQVVSGTAQQVKNERGVAVLVPFTVAYTAAV